MTSRFLTLALLLLSSPALAAPVRLAFEAPPTCPDERTFASVVHEAEPTAIATNDAAAPLATVRIEAKGGAYHAEIRWTGDDVRIAEAPSCDTVTRAAALVVATKAADPPSPPAAKNPPPPAVPAPIPSPPAGVRPAAEAPVAKPKPPPGYDIYSAGAFRSDVVGGQWSNTMAIGFRVRPWKDAPISIAGELAGGADTNEAYRGGLYTGALVLCPYGVASGRFSIAACSRTELGLVTARPVDEPGTETSPWFAFGVGFTARVQITDWWFVSLAADTLFAPFGHGAWDDAARREFPHRFPTSSVPSTAIVVSAGGSGSASGRWSAPIQLQAGFSW